MTGAVSTTIAPGGPGSLPTWTSSAKDMVTTALGTSRLWVTLGYGIVNEVYWPSTGEPQIRDLGFIVAGPFGWTEVKRAGNYEIISAGTLCAAAADRARGRRLPAGAGVRARPAARRRADLVPPRAARA